MSVFGEPTVVELRTAWLRGPVHDWFLVPAWLHEQMHAEGIEHEHRTRREQGGHERRATPDTGARSAVGDP